MPSAIKRLRSLGLNPANILIPKKEISLEHWAVVACDQFTSNRDYWQRVKTFVDNKPSSLNLIYPEVYLDDGNEDEIIENINLNMNKYLENELFDLYKNCFILVKRTLKDTCRWGLVGTIDLEKYDYSVDSTSLIRATEGTILSRIPPRKEIRKNAPLEIPHIMVLINDEEKSLIEPFTKSLSSFKKIYDTPLMENGGRIQGFLIDDNLAFESISLALNVIYETLDKSNPLLFAMGDGNHSLATAKSCWEDIKANLSEEEKENHPARFALVEIENIHDEGLTFEPIHRVLFDFNKSDFESLLAKYCDSFETFNYNSTKELKVAIEEIDGQTFGFASQKNGLLLYKINNPKASISPGTIQLIIDEIVRKNLCTLDYIHGFEETINLGKEDNNIGLLMPDISKHSFFDAIIKDKALPRKTFSMGEAHEKRYYMEARRLS